MKRVNIKQIIVSLTALALAGLCQVAHANVITVTFPEINGAYYTSGFPLPAVNWDTELYSITAGQSIVGASISGIWGSTSQFYGSTAETELYVNGLLVSDTTTLSPDPYLNVVPFSFTYTPGDLATLASGSATLSYIQTSQYQVRLSQTTLTIETAPSGVPDSGGISCLLMSLASLAGYFRFGRKA